jgi:hypothetical protein
LFLKAVPTPNATNPVKCSFVLFYAESFFLHGHYSLCRRTKFRLIINNLESPCMFRIVVTCRKWFRLYFCLK